MQGTSGSKGEERKVSPAERIFLAIHKAACPYMIQLVLEGEGHLQLDELKAAVTKAAAVNPGMRMRCKGFLGSTRWVVHDETPHIKVLQEQDYPTLEDCDAHQFVTPEWKSVHGPVCEIILVEGVSPKLIIRGLHAAMDGQGALHILQEIFRALGSKPLIGSSLYPGSDTIVTMHGKSFIRPATSFLCQSPTGGATLKAPGFVRHRITLPGKYPAISAQLAAILAEESYQRGASHANFFIPVDLRQRMSGLQSISCLASLMQIDVSKGDSWQQVYGQLLKKLHQKMDCQYGKSDHLLRNVPLAIIAMIVKNEWKRSMKENKHNQTGVISNMGKIHLSDFTAAGFTPKTLYDIPVINITTPLMIVTFELDDFVELTISMPRALTDGNRLPQLLDTIRQKLQRA
jgi:NRPS condensation-like uncharacterized protein